MTRGPSVGGPYVGWTLCQKQLGPYGKWTQCAHPQAYWKKSRQGSADKFIADSIVFGRRQVAFLQIFWGPSVYKRFTSYSYWKLLHVHYYATYISPNGSKCTVYRLSYSINFRKLQPTFLNRVWEILLDLSLMALAGVTSIAMRWMAKTSSIKVRFPTIHIFQKFLTSIIFLTWWFMVSDDDELYLYA